MKALICLIGLHGSGKTTIAQSLVERMGCTHLSVGNLARLARRGKAPIDVPSNVMMLLARTKPGNIMDKLTSTHLIKHINHERKIAPVVIDGFPSCPEHLGQLDQNCVLAEITVEDDTRSSRLLLRSEKTSRHWTPGLPSARDEMVDQTMQAAIARGLHATSFTNDGTSADLVACSIEQWLCGLKLSNASFVALESPP